MRLGFLFILLLVFSGSNGQNKQLLYNVDGLPQTLMSNPGASIDFNGHVGLPLLSQFSFSAGSTGVSVHDIFQDSNTNINTRITRTMRRLTSRDYFTATQQLEVVSLGWRLDKDHYLSAGIYQELDFFSYFPKDPAILVNEGNNDYINVPFDFSHVSFTGDALIVYHLGLNKVIDRQLTVGARVKLYSGIFNAESVNNTGMFITRNTPEGPNYYRHYAENVNIRVNTSGYTTAIDNNATVQEATADILSRSFFGGNAGAGLDLGATYIINENLIATGSIQDIGLMWQQQDVENYLYYGSYRTDGLEPLFPDAPPGGTAIPYWDIFEDEVERNLIDETRNENYITWRPWKINSSLEYGFGQSFAPCTYIRPVNRRHTNLLGIQFFGIKRPRGLNYAFTTYYDRKFSSRLRMRLAYTIDDFSYTNIGFLVSTQLKRFNFYLAADNLIGYFNLAKTHSASVQVGMQFVFMKL
jgi:hypothetical protein